MTHPPRIIFFDLDGTLVDGSHLITSVTRMWLHRLNELGVICSCATGRPFFGALSLIRSLALRGPSITFGGSLVRVPTSGETLLEVTIDATVVQRLSEWVRERGAYFERYTADEYFISAPHRYGEIHGTYLGHPPVISAALTPGPILKCVLIERSADLSCAAELRAAFPELLISSSMGAANPEIRFLNITAGEATKIRALSLALAAVGLTLADAGAFGDSEADLINIQSVAYGYVMANAAPEVLAKAPRRTGHVAVGGVGEVLGQLFGRTF